MNVPSESITFTYSLKNKTGVGLNLGFPALPMFEAFSID